jgi:hypothetical protein
MKEPIRITRATAKKPRPKDADLGFGQVFTDHMFLADFQEEKGWYDPRVEPYAPIPLDPAAVGRKVLAGLAKGRTIVNRERQARGAERAAQVGYLILTDRAAGHPDRGRPRRIRRALGGTLSESRIRKIIARLQMSARISAAYAGPQKIIGGTYEL